MVNMIFAILLALAFIITMFLPFFISENEDINKKEKRKK